MTHTARTSHSTGSIPRRPTQLALSLVAAALALLALAPSAQAFQTRTPLGTFGPDGTSGTSFARANGLAFNQANDKLYVLDSPAGTDSTIHAFNAPANTPAGGAFPVSVLSGGSASPIAVDNTLGGSANNIYYNNVEDTFGFNSAGSPLGGNFPIDVPPAPGGHCGAAVDSAGNIWLAHAGFLSLRRYDSAGNPLGEITITQGIPCALAFDSNDDLYVAISSQTPGASGVWRFTAASNYKAVTQVVSGSTGAIAVDRSTHTLYAIQNFQVVAYDLTLTPPLAPLYKFGRSGGGSQALTVDESADRVYVSGQEFLYDSSGNIVSTPSVVRVYGALADFPDATATPCSATNVTTTSADLCASIDDNSALPTLWFFQLSKDGGATWAKSCPSGIGGVTSGGQSGFAVSCTATGLQSGTDYLFRLVTNKGAGATDIPSTTLGFQTVALPPASAALNPAANVTTTSADLSATIDDNSSFPTNWRFQVSKDGGATWANTGVSGVTAGNQSGVAVSGTATGLDPNTTYHFRIATSKGAGSVDTNFGDFTFTTLLAPPLLSSVGSYAVTDTSAYLTGEIDPRNDATSYLFKYGSSPGALDSSTPPTGVPARGKVVVSQPIGNLDPNTDYYFKLLATNGAGPTESAVVSLHTRATPLPDDHPSNCSNEALRQAQGATFLPDCRAYEQVSPVDKNFGDAGLAGGTAARDGQALFFGMFTGFGDPPGQVAFISTSYISRRGPAGWHTRWPGEPECIDPSATGDVIPSPNLDRVVITHNELASCPLPPLDPAAPTSRNFYLGDYSAGGPPTYSLLTPQPGSADGFVGNDDFSHIVYRSQGQQTPDAPGGTFTKLFEWDNGTLRLVSRDPANLPFTTSSTVENVSALGDRIFFSNPQGSPTQEIYMRQTGTVTYDVSASECTSSCGTDSADSFRGATPAGNKALIMSAAKLTNDDSSATGQDLYLYTHSANPATQKNLTLISKDSEPADGTKSDVQGVTGMSDDGDTVFFLANGQLVTGQPTAPGAKLYRWRRNGGSPSLDYLATFGDNPIGSAGQITPDGAYLFLYTSTRLDPAADHDTDRDVYRWSAQGGWACLSCQLPGVPSAGSSPILSTGEKGLAFSDDGQRAFFSSFDSLLPDDANDGLGDVYEWHDGRLSLISSGLEFTSAGLLGAGRSGEDVFFTTQERLVGWDTDHNSDIYDARVGGGFPEPPPTGAECEGEACRGAPTSASPLTPAGSAAFEGPGNSPPPGCRKGKVARHGRCVAKKHHSKKRKHQRAKHDRRAG